MSPARGQSGFRSAGQNRVCLASRLAWAVLTVCAQASAGSLADLSLEDLQQVEVTSVSKAPQPVSEAPAAIFVITRDDIRRSGATSLPEVLRLAPNLLVTQLGSSNFVLAARGFGGNPDAQNFSNKLLMLIDGRSVYSPLFSGIYLDTQDVLLADVDRIEVISGPGAALWGANAVNGVINVITRPASLTTGSAVEAAAGNTERLLSARHGGWVGEQGAYRVYAVARDRDAIQLASGDSAEDAWHRGQAGFRIDLDQQPGSITFQGDVYAGSNDKAGPGRQKLGGANLLGRWERPTDDGGLQVQGYLDHVDRGEPAGGTRFRVDTFDLEFQHSLRLAAAHQLIWGAGARFNHYRIVNTDSLLFEPSRDTLHVWNAFVQDTMTLGPGLDLTLGTKLEHNSYSGWEPQPDLRLAWQHGSTMLWGAVSLAVRAPTPFDADVIEKVADMEFLRANRDFASERVLAYEVGVRAAPAATFNVSVSVFYNEYEDLRTVEASAPPTYLPLYWDNLMAGHAFGMTAWATWQVSERWRLAPGFSLLRKRLHQKEGASGLLDTQQSGNDPRLHALLTSTLDLGNSASLDVTLRHVSRLPAPALPAYTEMSARLGWRAAPGWELSIQGAGLMHLRHQEYPSPAGIAIGRSITAAVRWTR